VNAVAPGVIETDISNLRKTETGRNLTPGMQSLKRIGEQEDLADVIAFLSSDRARWITGVRIPWTVVQSSRPKHQPAGPNVHWIRVKPATSWRTVGVRPGSGWVAAACVLRSLGSNEQARLIRNKPPAIQTA
jgi:hypothetical protein